MADRPLRPATDRRLGRPLPHQLPNRTQAAPKAPHGFEPQLPCGISPSFPGLSPTSGYIPTRYSPVRRCRHRPRDLHVLSMPPAFALSQDQTLRFISAARPKPCRTDAFSIRLRSPLSMQRSPSGHCPCSQTLITGSGNQGTTTARACFQKTDATVKERFPVFGPPRHRMTPSRHWNTPHHCRIAAPCRKHETSPAAIWSFLPHFTRDAGASRLGREGMDHLAAGGGL